MSLWRLLVLALFAIVCFWSGTQAQDTDAAAHAEAPATVDGEVFTFQAEVTRLMDIIINSLYSKKDVFLRELISNASDALDKIRFLALTNKELLGDDESDKLDIRISVDKENQVLSIQDKGIGMTKDELVNNLGTIAKSGTSAFFEKLQQAENDLTLIGQFGVGFYSVFLVADKVQVVSKNPNDTQHVWESSADGKFTVREDTESESIGRGTKINIFLKEENVEYADTSKLKELVEKYSEFINFPIYLEVEKEIDVPIEVEDDDYEPVEGEEDANKESEDEDKEDKEDDDGVVDEEEEGEEKEKKPKTRKEKVMEWDLLNSNKAIWLRDPKSVSEDDYNNFYKALAHAYDEPMGHSHFKAEGGDVEFRAILFIPARPAWDFYDSYYQKGTQLKMFVRRVFISDDIDELLPRYLRFLVGVIDSDTLPLNVSREMLQQLEAIDTVKKKLVRKALELIRRLAEPPKDLDEDEELDGEKEEEEEKADSTSKKYENFWKEYGKALKMGIIEDSGNRIRLAQLLRFQSSKSGDKLVSLSEYVANMKEGQKSIYYLTGASLEEVDTSPFLERLKARGYEVLYMTDAMDEYMMQHLADFEGTPFANASKDELKLSDKDDKEKKADKAIKEEFKPLTQWWQQLLGNDIIEKVKVSGRLQTTPCIVVTSKFGWTANMERIMRSQALGDQAKQMYMKGRKILEINPRHPLIKSLKEKVSDDEEDEQAKLIARTVYDVALLESGFVIDEAKDVARRVHLMAKSMMGFTEELDDVELPEEGGEEDEEEEEEDASDEADAAKDEGEEDVGEDDVVFDEEELHTEL